MKSRYKFEIEDYWKDYIPLKYVTKFNLMPQSVIKRSVESTLHQTKEYIVEPFYKVISKIDP